MIVAYHGDDMDKIAIRLMNVRQNLRRLGEMYDMQELDGMSDDVWSNYEWVTHFVSAIMTGKIHILKSEEEFIEERDILDETGLKTYP